MGTSTFLLVNICLELTSLINALHCRVLVCLFIFFICLTFQFNNNSWRHIRPCNLSLVISSTLCFISFCIEILFGLFCGRNKRPEFTAWLAEVKQVIHFNIFYSFALKSCFFPLDSAWISFELGITKQGPQLVLFCH